MVSEKSQKDFTTKQVIVPAKYLLQAIAGDKRVSYPVFVIVISRRGGGASYLINSAEELLSICHSKSVFECGVVHAGWKRKHIHIELKEDGRLGIHKEVLPGKRHMDTLDENDVVELYGKILTA